MRTLTKDVEVTKVERKTIGGSLDLIPSDATITGENPRIHPRARLVLQAQHCLEVDFSTLNLHGEDIVTLCDVVQNAAIAGKTLRLTLEVVDP